MNNKLFINIFRFIGLIALQVLIFNYVHLFGFLNPYIYILALLLLPFETPKWIQVLIAFATGLIIDMFALSYGIHASASLMVIFVRPFLVNLLNGNKSDISEQPVPGQKSFNWLFLYTVILVFIHHFIITMLEVFTFTRFYITLGVIVLNTLFTSFIILCTEYIFIPASKRK